MSARILPLALPTLLLPAPVLANPTTENFTGFSMDFVEIGDAGNADDDTGYGAVGYNYRIGVEEVSRAMILSYNTHSGGPTIAMYDYEAGGVVGGNMGGRPATEVSWNEAARFVNWLNTSQGYSAAYNFTTGGANDNIALWTVGDSGYDPTNPFRNSNAHYFLPSEDEWYKAAYYDPNANGGEGGYWDYATGSDTAPTAVWGGASGAVYLQTVSSGPAPVRDAGGLSPYGTMAQGGNAFEWAESNWSAPNDDAGESRVLRGGSWANDSPALQSWYRVDGTPTAEAFFIGFRVASKTPPNTQLRMLHIVKIGRTVTVDIVSNTGNVDVYRSIDLIDYGPSPIAQDVAPGQGVEIDSIAPDERAFYIAVPHGSPAP